VNEKGHMLDDSPLAKEKIELLKSGAEDMLKQLETKKEQADW